MKDSIAVAVITYNRPDCLDRFIGALYPSRALIGNRLLVVHTGQNYEGGPIEQATKAAGFIVTHRSVVNILPLARDFAERTLIEDKAAHLLITDDDVVFEHTFLESALRQAKKKSQDYAYGGGLWMQENWKVCSDDDYMRGLANNQRVEPKAAVYSSKFSGLWRRVAELGVTFTGEDQAWCYLAKDAGMKFVNMGFVGLHASPTRPSDYADFPDAWRNFIAAFKAARGESHAGTDTVASSGDGSREQASDADSSGGGDLGS